MQSLRRVPLQARRATNCLLRQQPRRYASDSHNAPNAHPVSANESFGRGFFVTLAVLPITILAVSYTAGDGKENTSYMTNLIKRWTSTEETWSKRNDTHTDAIEMAADDRALFFDGQAETEKRHVGLRFPELFNTGGPYNIHVGHGSGNIDQVIAKYQKENYEANEEKHKALRENRVRAEQPVTETQPINRHSTSTV